MAWDAGFKLLARGFWACTLWIFVCGLRFGLRRYEIAMVYYYRIVVYEYGTIEWVELRGFKSP